MLERKPQTKRTSDPGVISLASYQDTLLSQITGMNVETIRRGRQELDDELNERSAERIRTAGGGQPSAEKKTRSYKRH